MKKTKVVLFMALAALTVLVSGKEPDTIYAAKPTVRRCGIYLHACWTYNYPFALRSWQRRDYNDMFQLLKHIGYNTVMFWPCAEAVPAPISETDRKDLTAFREIIEDGHKYGMETWLVLCAVTSNPAIAVKPWMQRSLFTQMKTVRLDNPQEAEAFLKHRAALIEILNNADGYVLIDGDPGSYPGAKPEDFAKVCLHDRITIDRVGTHPKTQKVIPWIWSGWGIKRMWGEPIAPYTAPTLEALKQQMQEPWELLPGRGIGPQGVNIELVNKAGLLGRSTLLFYDAIEVEPSQPGSKLQFDVIRDAIKTESPFLSGSLGLFCNVQTALMVLPNVYFFSRCAADPSYANQPDAKVLYDLAQLLGGPPTLLVPAWSCLQLGLDKFPVDLPAKLRAATLSGEAASFLPGGAPRYLDILASQVEARIRLLQACQCPAKTPEEAAAVIADGMVALHDWWKLHRYVGMGTEADHYRLSFVGQYEPLKAWCIKNVTDPERVIKLAVKELVARGTLTEPVAVYSLKEELFGDILRKIQRRANPAKHLAYKKPITASSVYGPEFEAGNAVDGQVNEEGQVSEACWASAGTNESPWLLIDLQKKETVKTIELQFRNRGGVFFAVPSKVELQLSDDGKEFITAAHMQQLPEENSSFEMIPYIMKIDKPARYVRLNFGPSQAGIITGAVEIVEVIIQ